jgi:hypothetical protein
MNTQHDSPTKVHSFDWNWLTIAAVLAFIAFDVIAWQMNRLPILGLFPSLTGSVALGGAFVLLLLLLSLRGVRHVWKHTWWVTLLLFGISLFHPILGFSVVTTVAHRGEFVRIVRDPILGKFIVRVHPRRPYAACCYFGYSVLHNAELLKDDAKYPPSLVAVGDGVLLEATAVGARIRTLDEIRRRERKGGNAEVPFWGITRAPPHFGPCAVCLALLSCAHDGGWPLKSAWAADPGSGWGYGDDDPAFHAGGGRLPGGTCASRAGRLTPQRLKP